METCNPAGDVTIATVTANSHASSEGRGATKTRGEANHTGSPRLTIRASFWRLCAVASLKAVTGFLQRGCGSQACWQRLSEEVISETGTWVSAPSHQQGLCWWTLSPLWCWRLDQQMWASCSPSDTTHSVMSSMRILTCIFHSHLGHLIWAGGTHPGRARRLCGVCQHTQRTL